MLKKIDQYILLLCLFLVATDDDTLNSSAREKEFAVQYVPIEM